PVIPRTFMTVLCLPASRQGGQIMISGSNLKNCGVEEFAQKSFQGTSAGYREPVGNDGVLGDDDCGLIQFVHPGQDTRVRPVWQEENNATT
ncbi:MAG TPA: hypothetical protein VGR89_14455, partial [Puia sp.]|nr:hypothetical protein [Puia sp.]